MTPAPRDYETQKAIATLRKAMIRRPEIANQLMEGMTKEVAFAVLTSAQRELKELQVVTRAIVEAAEAIVKIDANI